MKNFNIDIPVYIAGLGIVFHSGGIAKTIPEQYDYLRNEYWEAAKVAEHIRKGDMVGFCTGSPGDYILKFRPGYPDASIEKAYPIGIRLGICVDDGKIYIRDLYELMEWSKECDENMQIELENGIYHITLQTQIPESGIVGDNQIIYVYLNELDEMPQLMWQGVPQLMEC